MYGAPYAQNVWPYLYSPKSYLIIFMEQTVQEMRRFGARFAGVYTMDVVLSRISIGEFYITSLFVHPHKLRWTLVFKKAVSGNKVYRRPRQAKGFSLVNAFEKHDHITERTIIGNADLAKQSPA